MREIKLGKCVGQRSYFFTKCVALHVSAFDSQPHMRQNKWTGKREEKFRATVAT